MSDRVTCHAGSRYPERPTRFEWQGEWLAVEAVERQWREPGRIVFDVRAADGRRFALTYDVGAGTWQVGQGTRPDGVPAPAPRKELC